MARKDQLSIFDDKSEVQFKRTTATADRLDRDLKKLTLLATSMGNLLTNMLKDMEIDDEPVITKNESIMQQPTTEVLAALNQCTIEGNVVKLGPAQLDKKVYGGVKDALEKIGGKWKGGKIFGFQFEHDPADLLSEIQAGEKRNLKKEFQFFGTPDSLADKLVGMAEIEDGMCVLEPSAGQGAIIKAIFRAFPRDMMGPNDRPCVTVDYYELMQQNAETLSRNLRNVGALNRCSCMGRDFMENAGDWKYDRIVANPPFTKNQDIEHIYEMYHLLKSGGILVSMASKHWQLSTAKKEEDFTNWLHSVHATVENVPAGAFKESGTDIATCIIKIVKS